MFPIAAIVADTCWASDYDCRNDRSPATIVADPLALIRANRKAFLGLGYTGPSGYSPSQWQGAWLFRAFNHDCAERVSIPIYVSSHLGLYLPRLDQALWLALHLTVTPGVVRKDQLEAALSHVPARKQMKHPARILSGAI